MRLPLLLPLLAGFFFHGSVTGAEKFVQGSVKLPPGAGSAEADLFVVWSDRCSEKGRKGAVELKEKDFRYEPPAIAAVIGSKLRVHNADSKKHNSFALKKVGFDSGLQKPGSTYEVNLDKPGLTKVFCRIHPAMAADVLVLPSVCYRELRGREALASFSLPIHADGNPGKVWLWSPRLKGFLSVEPMPGARADFSPSRDQILDKVAGTRDSAY